MTPPILGIWASQISGHLWEPAGAYDALATVTVPSGGIASIDFAGIPTGYKHLQLRGIFRSAGTQQNTTLAFNGDSGNNYSWHYLLGDGSAASAGANTSQPTAGLIQGTQSTDTANVFAAAIIDVLDYASTSKNKTVRIFDGYDLNGSGRASLWSGAWYNTSAINTIKIANSSNFAQYSQFALYGVK